MREDHMLRHQGLATPRGLRGSRSVSGSNDIIAILYTFQTPQKHVFNTWITVIALNSLALESL